MSAFKPQQRHLSIRGRDFHFVSYEGGPVRRREGEPIIPAMWYLMVEGRRCAALPWDPAQSLADVDRALERWVADNTTGPVEQRPKAAPPRAQPPNRHRMTWWGPG